MWKKKNWSYLALTLAAQSLLQATPSALAQSFADAQTPVRVQVRTEAAKLEREQARAWANRQRRPIARASSTLLKPAGTALVASRVVITQPKMVDQQIQAESAAPAPALPAAEVRKAVLVDSETQFEVEAPAAPAAEASRAVLHDQGSQLEDEAPAAPAALVLPVFYQPEKKSVGHCRPKSQSDASLQASDLMKNLDEIVKKDQVSEKDQLNAIKKRITDEASDEEVDSAFNALKDWAESDAQACRKYKSSLVEGFRRLAKHYAMQDEKRRGRPEIGDDEGYDSYADSDYASYSDEADSSFYRGDSSADGGYSKAKGIISEALTIRCLKEDRRLGDVLENLNDNHMVYQFKRNGTQSMEVNANFYGLYNYRVSRMNDACTGWNVGMECQIAARALQNTQSLPYYAQQAQMQRYQSQMAVQQMINTSMNGGMNGNMGSMNYPMGNHMNGNIAPIGPTSMGPGSMPPGSMASAPNYSTSAPNLAGGFYGSGRQTF